jgi:hypothetical protein
VRALEAASAVDVFRLREARALLAMAKRAARPQSPRQRLLAAVRPVADPKPGARVIADLTAKGINIARAPGDTVAQNGRRAPAPASDRAMDRMIESPRQDGAPRQPHPGALRRENVPIARPK